MARLQFERGFADSFRHSSFGLAYRWPHPCRRAPRNQLLGSSLPTLGLTGLVLLYKGIPNGSLGFGSLLFNLPARRVHRPFAWSHRASTPLYLACAASNSAFPRMAVIGIDCHFHGQGLVARFSKEFGPTIPWRPFAGLLLAYACTSKSALLLTGGQFVPR